MEAWLLAVVIVVPICLIILAVAIYLLCKRCCQRRSQDELIDNDYSSYAASRSFGYYFGSQRWAQRNVNHDVESQRNHEIDLFNIVKQIYFETSTGYPKLDLHNYNLSNAMTVFKIFLQISIAEYKNNNHIKHKRFILVVTGRGLHSPNGIPIIKPAVESYLKAYGYKYNWSNPGMARIDLLPFKDQNHY